MRKCVLAHEGVREASERLHDGWRWDVVCKRIAVWVTTHIFSRIVNPDVGCVLPCRLD